MYRLVFFVFFLHLSLSLQKKQYLSPPFLTLYSTNIELNLVAERQS